MNKKSTFIIYHSKDLDGFASGAIARMHLDSIGLDSSDYEMIGWDYGDPIPELKNHDVIMLDISFPPEEMEKIYKDNLLTWIDHHQSAIDNSEEHEYWKCNGIRKVGDSASLLAWEFYFKGCDISDTLYYVDRYDVFKGSGNSTWDQVLKFQYGARVNFGDPKYTIEYKKWKEFLLEENCAEDFDKISTQGEGIYLYIQEENKRVARMAWPSVLDGCVEVPYHRPDIDILDHVDTPNRGAIKFSYRDKGKFFYSFRKRKDSNIDILGYCKAKGGGGHEFACGYEVVFDQNFK